MGDKNWSANIPANKPVDGKSLLPILKNQNTVIRPWAFSEIFKLTTDSSDGKSMRNVDYKLIKFDYGQEEFYHLAIDSLESNNLLNGTLSSTDLTNYNYLCNEMTTLVGSGSYCNSSVGIVSTSKIDNAFIAYPNPFSDHIILLQSHSNKSVVMTDAMGNTVYNGKDIEKQDFSSLAKGLYFLKLIGNDNSSQQLIKE
jgi:hypothetical protein